MHRATLLSLILGALTLLPAGAAGASCFFDERSLDQQVAEADVVFVGTVVELDQTASVATFAVQEVWKGGDLPARLTVAGGTGEPGVVTSVDRFWEPEVSYLVFPRREGDRYADDSCSPTRPVDEEVNAARPASVSEPTGSPDAPSDPGSWLWIAVAGGALAVAGGSAAASWWRRRTRA